MVFEITLRDCGMTKIHITVRKESVRFVIAAVRFKKIVW